MMLMVMLVVMALVVWWLVTRYGPDEDEMRRYNNDKRNKK